MLVFGGFEKAACTQVLGASYFIYERLRGSRSTVRRIFSWLLWEGSGVRNPKAIDSFAWMHFFL